MIVNHQRKILLTERTGVREMWIPGFAKTLRKAIYNISTGGNLENSRYFENLNFLARLT
jgi:hypothetical protein